MKWKQIDDFLGKVAKWIVWLIVAAAIGYFIYNYVLPYWEGKYKFFIEYIGVLMVVVAEVFTTMVGIMYGTWSIIVIGVCLTVVQGRNFIKWRKEKTPWW